MGPEVWECASYSDNYVPPDLVTRDDPFLVGAYVFGAVLEARAAVDVVQVAFVLNLPPHDLTWCAQPQSCAGLPHLLEIDKAPVEWYWRPALWPVSNHVIDRPLRIWSLDGPDTVALDALDRADAETQRLPAPTDADAREQLTTELAASADGTVGGNGVGPALRDVSAAPAVGRAGARPGGRRELWRVA